MYRSTHAPDHTAGMANVVMCGAGASGSGALIAAAQHGFLADIKEQGGLVAFTTGTGAEDFFRHLTNHSNSHGSVFTECLLGLRAVYADDHKAIAVLDALERKASCKDLDTPWS